MEQAAIQANLPGEESVCVFCNFTCGTKADFSGKRLALERKKLQQWFASPDREFAFLETGEDELNGVEIVVIDSSGIHVQLVQKF